MFLFLPRYRVEPENLESKNGHISQIGQTSLNHMEKGSRRRPSIRVESWRLLRRFSDEAPGKLILYQWHRGQ